MNKKVERTTHVMFSFMPGIFRIFNRSGFKTSDQIQGPRYLAGFHIDFYQNYGVQEAQADRESAVRHTFWRMIIYRRSAIRHEYWRTIEAQSAAGGLKPLLVLLRPLAFQ
jgi:hypothetical protein